LDSLIFVVVGVVVLLFKPSQKKNKEKIQRRKKKAGKTIHPGSQKKQNYRTNKPN